MILISTILQNSANFEYFKLFLRDFENSVSLFSRFWKILQNEYLIGKIGVDTAENEPPKEWCVLAVWFAVSIPDLAFAQ